MKSVRACWSCLAILALAVSVAADEEPKTPPKVPTFDENYAGFIANNPPDVSFKVTFKDGKNQFRPGEIVHLELEFSSRVPNKYIFDAATYDRSGRMSEERFMLDPRGGVDPLADYFASQMGWMGGGLRSTPALGEKPQTLVLDLNEWLRIDKPGKYRLAVMSGRLSSDPPPDPKNRQSVTQTVTSPILDLEILPPDPAWAEKQLAAAVDAWQTGDKKAQAEALRTLRYLGTEGAAKELVRLAASPDIAGNIYTEVQFGLYGSPHRALIVKEMEAALDDPDRPIMTGFLRVLTELAFKLRNPDLTRYGGVVFSMNPDDAKKQAEAMRQAFAKYRAAHLAVEREIVLRLAKAFDAKTGRAKAVTVATLLGVLASPQWAGDAEAANLMPRLRGQVASVFLDLPPNLQETLLGYQWEMIADPSLLPVLLKIYAAMPLDKTSYDAAGHRSVYLMKILQLSPEEGRKLVLAELKRPTAALQRPLLAPLMALPDKTLPELDDVLSGQLAETSTSHLDGMEMAARLLARYGTAAALPRAKKFYGDGSGHWACDLQASLLAYFLRVDEPFGLERLREALTRRSKDYSDGRGFSHCYSSVLRDVSGIYACPAMEKVALEFLEDADPEVASTAAAYIGRHGALADKAALFARLERWHNEWKERKQDLEYNRVGESKYPGQTGLEDSLVRALCEAGAWLLTPDEVRRVKELCVTENAANASPLRDRKPGDKVNVTISRMADGSLWCNVESYNARSMESLKAKIAQYPKGTVFQVTPSSPVAPDRAQLMADLRAFVETRGMAIEDYKPEEGTLDFNYYN
jgi:hypothetical protein